jgi:nucleoside 2-deoxyribosyltransferase
VLLPYDKVHDRLYATVIQPAIEKHMAAVRLDRLPKSDAIYSSFADAVQSCSAVVADITSINESVMYEIGYTHARGLRPLIYTQDPERRQGLPVYLRALNVQLATEKTLNSLIENYLLTFKRHRMAPPPPRLNSIELD